MMQTVILMVIFVFLAMLGLVHLILGVGRWLSSTGTLSGCMLVARPPDDPNRAEAMLQQAAQLLELEPELHEMRMLVVCPAASPSREIAERFCKDKDILIFESWQQVNCPEC